MTEKAESRAEFHARRAKGIGGSDVGAILGLSRYKDAEELWLEKTGQKPRHDDDALTPDQERGIVFESIALQKFREQTGYFTTATGQKRTGKHPDYPWMLYNVDAYVVIEGNELIGEVKCPSLGMFSKIKREGLPEDWIVQMQHYLCCTGFERGVWIIFCADRMELLYFIIEADALFHETVLIPREREFWTLVETMSPPEPIVAEMKDGKIEVVGKVEKRYDDEARQAFQLLAEAKAMVKSAEEIEDQAVERVVEVIGDRYGIFEAPGIGRVNRSERTRRGSFDAEALANAQPLDRIAVLANIVRSMEVEQRWAVMNAQNIIDGCDLDLSGFYKPASTYTEVRFYSSKGGE